MAESETPADGESVPTTPETPESAPTAGVGPAGATVPLVPTRRRDQNFRLELVKRLPRLAASSWSVKENFKIDEEWGSVANLRADAVLEALERVAPERLK
jgi:hypothetical protein